MPQRRGTASEVEVRGMAGTVWILDQYPDSDVRTASNEIPKDEEGTECQTASGKRTVVISVFEFRCQVMSFVLK